MNRRALFGMILGSLAAGRLATQVDWAAAEDALDVLAIAEARADPTNALPSVPWEHVKTPVAELFVSPSAAVADGPWITFNPARMADAIADASTRDVLRGLSDRLSELATGLAAQRFTFDEVREELKLVMVSLARITR